MKVSRTEFSTRVLHATSREHLEKEIKRAQDTIREEGGMPFANVSIAMTTITLNLIMWGASFSYMTKEDIEKDSETEDPYAGVDTQ